MQAPLSESVVPTHASAKGSTPVYPGQCCRYGPTRRLKTLPSSLCPIAPLKKRKIKHKKRRDNGKRANRDVVEIRENGATQKDRTMKKTRRRRRREDGVAKHIVSFISSYGNSNKTGSTRVNGGLIPSDWCQ